jgi:hypothetical protein
MNNSYAEWFSMFAKTYAENTQNLLLLAQSRKKTGIQANERAFV